MTSFSQRIARAAGDKMSRIVLALDSPADKPALQDFATKTINAVEQYICAIKMNFHLILPLSAAEISQINKTAHSYGLQSIADIKLNDIENTNRVALDLLVKMGFDSVIANPFMGKKGLTTLVQGAHGVDAGVIALVYMSHPDASEGYGLEEKGGTPLYKTFLDRAAEAGADGIVVGATQLEILRQVAKQSIPVYSPGVGTQGGDLEDAIKNGADYLIIGRSIIDAEEPARAAKEMQDRILAVSK
jgi:orotidine-5'-phosphate decarboxylase